MDEFRSIETLFRPLAAGAPEALGLLDDAAALPSRPGFDLIVTKDALVEGVHFLPDDPPDLIARKLLRVNLSDLAAKAAEPYGYLLATAWPPAWGEGRRALFAEGLAQDQRAFGLKLFGGDTVSTPGPLTLSATMLGWTPAGSMVKRSTARIGDVVLVSGSIGDGGLGLAAAQGRFAGSADACARLAARYRVPEPRIALRACLLRYATAAADVSDGLLADAAHIAQASGVGVRIDLDRIPLSPEGRDWLASQGEASSALAALAAGGDDYEIVFTVGKTDEAAALAAAASAGVRASVVGEVTVERGLCAAYRGRRLAVQSLGWAHG